MDKLNIKFKFDKKIKNGQYSAKYFMSTKKILIENSIKNKSILRFKHFNDNVVVAGVFECLQLIKFTLNKKQLKNTKIYYVEDGTITNKDQPILLIEGLYQDFCYLENLIDSILSRRSSIATNCYKITNLIGSEKLIFMADRCDDYSIQAYDGYSAYIGGIRKFVTNEQVKFLTNVSDYSIVGTIPHALIQQYNGSLYNALIDFQKSFPKNPVLGLIDFYNNCLSEIQKLKDNGLNCLDYVRIDTSKKMIDECLKQEYEKTLDKNLFGVNLKLINAVRKKLDECGFNKTKIIISSSLDYELIKYFEQQKAPVDLYGVGKSLLNINLNFTGDLITLNGKNFAKVGRIENVDKYIKNMKILNFD